MLVALWGLQQSSDRSIAPKNQPGETNASKAPVHLEGLREADRSPLERNVGLAAQSTPRPETQQASETIANPWIIAGRMRLGKTDESGNFRVPITTAMCQTRFHVYA